MWTIKRARQRVRMQISPFCTPMLTLEAIEYLALVLTELNVSLLTRHDGMCPPKSRLGMLLTNLCSQPDDDFLFHPH